MYVVKRVYYFRLHSQSDTRPRFERPVNMPEVENWVTFWLFPPRTGASVRADGAKIQDLAGGGAATDHIVHLMDVFRWMLGDEVKRVYAELSKENGDSQVETHGLVLLEMHSGTVVSIDPSWSYPSAFPTWGDLTMEIVGEKGTLSLDLYKQSPRWYGEDSDKTALLPWMDDMDEGLIADFVESVKEGRSPSITGEDGLRTLSVVKASYKSMETGQFIDLAEIIDS